MALKELSSGAESTIYIEEAHGTHGRETHGSGGLLTVHKKRIAKDYRIAEIDIPLRKLRTRKEVKVLNSLHKLKLAVPRVIRSDEYDIEMEYIDGVQLKKILDERPELAELIGKALSVMHDAGIIHGDLTTSNMILKDDLYFIDFGLSFFSERIEDKAVDVHLFKQALLSRHFMVYDVAYKNFLKGYDPKDKDDILQRLRIVEQRGRYKERT